MKNKRLKLTDLKVQSFVTSANKIDDKQTNRVFGGENVSENHSYCDICQNTDPDCPCSGNASCVGTCDAMCYEMSDGIYQTDCQAVCWLQN